MSHTINEQEALALFDRLFGPVTTTTKPNSWKDKHRSDSLSSTDSYWQGQYLAVPDTPTSDWGDEYPYDLRETRSSSIFSGPRITVSPVESKSLFSLDNPNTAKKQLLKNGDSTAPIITIEFVEV